MRSLACRGLWVVCTVIALAGAAWAAEPEFAFGGGGPGVGLFQADLADINAFVESAGFPVFDGHPILVGGGGRGGVAPGLTYGGAGWGMWIEAEAGALHAEYGAGLGGFDLGFAFGADEHSLLTIGALIGGGGAELMLTEKAVVTNEGRSPAGIVVEPTRQVYDSAFALVAPYVDIQIQLLDWMGLGIRAGYVLPLFELNWEDTGPLDAPDLALPGPFVRLSLVFGGLEDVRPEPSDEDVDL